MCGILSKAEALVQVFTQFSLGPGPADSISVPDGRTSFPLTSFFQMFLAFQRPSLIHWHHPVYVFGNAIVIACDIKAWPINGITAT